MSSLRALLIVVAMLTSVAAAQRNAAEERRQGVPGEREAFRQTGQPAPPPRDVGAARPAVEQATGALAGTVTSADSGAPLRRVEIAAVPLAGAGFGATPRSTVTDDEGRFELDALPTGTWQITASKTGYSSQQYGQRRPFDRPRPMAIAPNARARADFALIRASAIGGRIYDEYGEPLAAARVDVLRSRMAQNRRYLQRVGEGDLTDDTGSFRIHGLPPGEYFVTASLRVAPADSIVQTTYAPTYYPGTGSFAEAQRILLAPGNDVVVDFPVLSFRTARVTGVVLDAAGSPADAFLNLSSEAGELGVPFGIGGATRPDGSFTLPEVPPGSYTLNAALKGGAAFGAEVAAIPLVVYGDDVSGVTLVTAKPATMRGTIVADAGVTARLPPKVSVGARSTRAGADSTFAEPERNAFELTVPIGPFRLRIEPPEGWAVKTVIVEDGDATDAVLDLRGRQDVPVRVVLTNRLSEVSGSVAIGPGAPAPSVLIFPYDSARWEPPSRYVRSAAVAADGTYRITGLPASAQYLAAAVDALEEGEAEDPDFLARIRDLATGFDLADGEKRVLNLNVLQR